MWYPSSVAMLTLNGTQLAYIGDSSSGQVFLSILNSNGTFDASSIVVTPVSAPAWNPRGITFASFEQ